MARALGPTAEAAAALRPGGWLALRDRLLSSPRFQRWAMGFPLTRWVARRRAKALFDLCAGFVYSQVLFACIRLRVLDHLAAGPLSLEDLAQRLALSEDAARRLLDAARALGLVGLRGPRRYGLGELGAALRGNPGVAAMIDHHHLLYADLADPVALLRGEPVSRQLAGYWPYAARKDAGASAGDGPACLGGADTAAYTALMSDSQAMIAVEVLDAYPIARHACLLDIGGGDGTFLAAAAARAPTLRLMLFDLPPVAAEARLRFARMGLAHRALAIGGDVRGGALPEGADIVSLVRVIHDHDDDAALAILRAARRALPPDGTLILAEPMAETRGAEAIGHAYFGFYLLAMGSGRPRSVADLSGLLHEAGFGAVRQVATRTPMLTSLLVAKPDSTGRSSKM